MNEFLMVALITLTGAVTFAAVGLYLIEKFIEK